MLFYIISLFLPKKIMIVTPNLVNVTNFNKINQLGENKLNKLELCPISSYKQCSNNYNSYHKIDSITQFNKPKIDTEIMIINIILNCSSIIKYFYFSKLN